GRAPGGGLGPGLPRHPQDRGPARPPAQGEARGGPQGPPLPGDGAGRGVPLPGGGVSLEAWTLPGEEAREGLLVHRDRRVVYLNPAAAELLAVDREKVRGLPLILALRDHRLEALALKGGEAVL